MNKKSNNNQISISLTIRLTNNRIIKKLYSHFNSCFNMPCQPHFSSSILRMIFASRRSIYFKKIVR